MIHGENRTLFVGNGRGAEAHLAAPDGSSLPFYSDLDCYRSEANYGYRLLENIIRLVRFGNGIGWINGYLESIAAGRSRLPTKINRQRPVRGIVVSGNRVAGLGGYFHISAARSSGLQFNGKVTGGRIAVVSNDHGNRIASPGV